MAEGSRIPFRQILIVVGASLVLAVSACFGMSLSNGNMLGEVLGVLAAIGVLTFLLGIVVLFMALIIEGITRLLRGKS